jgi:hypothetical protein
MNRSLKIVVSLLLLIGLSSILLAATADADPDALQIVTMTVTPDAESVTLKMTLNNTGSAAIDEFDLALAFFDGNGDQVYGYDNTIDGYTEEICNWYYAPSVAIAAGEDYLTKDIFTGYAGTVTIGAAIRYYHYVDGDYILIPESEWVWAFPGNETYYQTDNRSYYTSPPDSLYDSTNYDYFGNSYNYFLLDDYNASYYGKNQGGEWITSVEDNSPAALAGLQAGDLILFVDGVKSTENLYAVDYALSAITAGEKVDWVFERDGYVYVTRIANP